MKLFEISVLRRTLGLRRGVDNAEEREVHNYSSPLIIFGCSKKEMKLENLNVKVHLRNRGPVWRLKFKLRLEQ
jgi:hypothetical protein